MRKHWFIPVKGNDQIHTGYDYVISPDAIVWARKLRDPKYSNGIEILLVTGEYVVSGNCQLLEELERLWT